jgi:hypothetical protein
MMRKKFPAKKIREFVEYENIKEKSGNFTREIKRYEKKMQQIGSQMAPVVSGAYLEKRSTDFNQITHT